MPVKISKAIEAIGFRSLANWNLIHEKMSSDLILEVQEGLDTHFEGLGSLLFWSHENQEVVL
jgi:hypothetical protein